MKALRSIKPRTQEVEVHSDLRGLGDSSMMSDLSPEPILSVRGNHPELHALSAQFGAAVHPGVHHEEHVTHFHCTHTALTHKQKAIALFGMAIVARKVHDADCQIWIHNRLGHALTEGFEDKKHEVHAPHFEQTKTVSVDATASHFLHQAGFPIQVSETTQHLTNKHVTECLTHQEAAHHSTHTLRAVA